ncbi:IucA/IucC family protein [Solicola sp. PLA-1-18]|uniref:IucA/IucC family protein n=1 Tax=Solicola sp. PLA-1-18 TaxID=3380532 RepID=UPI003B771E6C
MSRTTEEPQDFASHLTPGAFARAQRALVAKALSEWSHERLLSPVDLGGGRWAVTSDDGAVTYRFGARRLSLDHWLVDASSIERERDGHLLPLDASDLVVELQGTLGMGADVLPVYLDEISSTLFGHAYKQARDVPGSKALVHADFQTVESAMSEGHPCFVANNGRIGFGADDYRAYAPETGSTVRLVWLAVRRERSVFAAVRGLDHEQLVASELDAATRARFDDRLRDLGLDPSDYHLLPAHPWQWFDRLAVTFAADVADRDVVCLGHGDDDHRPQQSVRTFFNASRPDRRYVKTAISVLNMGFMRGLSAAYMSVTPAIDDWLHDLLTSDEYLVSKRFTALREVAAIGYHRRHVDSLPAGSAHRKMLAALWRESPVPSLEPGQQLVTMASFLHRDDDGEPFLLALVEASGIGLDAWLRRWLDLYLSPLLHCIYTHDLAFMPHGENMIVVLEDAVPVRVILKDTGEEMVVMNTAVTLSEDVRRIQHDVSDEARALAIQTDVVDCFLRFVNAICVEHVPGYEEDLLWRAVADTVLAYQAEHPHLADRFARIDLFGDDFELVCLNRLQLADNRQMVDLESPDVTARDHGRLANPLARHRPSATH